MQAAILFFLSGLAWKCLLLVVLGDASPLWLTVLAAGTALFPPIAVASEIAFRAGMLKARLPARSLLPLFVAFPYPFGMAFSLYAERASFLPDSWNEAISGPTGFYVCVGGVLLASIPWTLLVVTRSWDRARPGSSEAMHDATRKILILFFLLTAIAILLPDPAMGVSAWKWGADLWAIPCFCGVYGRGLSVKTGVRQSSLML